VLEHIEVQLFAAGKGEFDRTHLLIAGLLERDAVRAVLIRDNMSTAKGQKAMKLMLENARDTLLCLSNGGTLQGERRLAFEAILAGLIPIDADEHQIISECSRLLLVDRGAVQRAMKRNADSAGFTGFVSVLHRPRKRRCDFIWLGRKVSAEFWHEMTRLDTRPGKKVKIRVGKNEYVEHWRHVQYMTDQEMAYLFFASAKYAQYLVESHNSAFKEDIFYQAKCKSIKQSDLEECSCPHCTVWREGVRSYHRQRQQWHREAKAAGKQCSGCACCDDAFLNASKSAGTLRTFLHRKCGKVSCPQLRIEDGPKSSEVVEFYRRQCCRVPLPELHDALVALEAADVAADAVSSAKTARSPNLAALVAKAAKAMEIAKKLAMAERYTISELRACSNCTECSWESSMPHCPIEWDDSKPATYKAYRPRLTPDGNSCENELAEIRTTRKGLMEHLKRQYNNVDPHLFIEEWTSHTRHLVYSILTLFQLAICTDFSAAYEHKAAWTSTCEHPPRSNMDVFVVTRVVMVNGERIYITDVWRIFSAAKGSAGFHNRCLSLIVEYYRHIMELMLVWVFTDGCRGQYKGKRNFRRISTFAHEHSEALFEKMERLMDSAPCFSTSSPSPPEPSAVATVALLSIASAASGAAATGTAAFLMTV